MLYAMLVASATLTFTLASLTFTLATDATRAAKARHLARLFQAQQKWAELMDRHDIGPRN